jgi:methylamine dehydrogenase accessory protein MauD
METEFMNDLILASYGLLWLIVLILSAIVVALVRQIGLLHTRLAPAGALMTSTGPEVGQPAPTLVIDDLEGNTVRIGGPRDHAQLIMFVAPSCPICKTLIPAARSLAKHERRRLDLVFASDGAEAGDHRNYIREMGLTSYPYVISMDLGLQFGVGKLPYAVLIGADGILRSRGLVNSREHLESLIESMDTGFGSIQDYVEDAGILGERA